MFGNEDCINEDKVSFSYCSGSGFPNLPEVQNYPPQSFIKTSYINVKQYLTFKIVVQKSERNE